MPTKKLKPIKAYAIVNNGLIVPSVKMRLFAIKSDAEDFVLSNYPDSYEADIIPVLITLINPKR